MPDLYLETVEEMNRSLDLVDQLIREGKIDTARSMIADLKLALKGVIIQYDN